MRNHSGIVVNVEVLAADYRRRIHAARDALGSPAQLDEALIATGIDCFITLLDGGTVTIEGETFRLARIGGTESYERMEPAE